MFTPSHFAIEDRDLIDRFIAQNNFGLLISNSDKLSIATHLPFVYADNSLHCHVARANGQWQELDGQNVLVVLPGPHAYVSPTWYADAGVPTWNYQAVHIYATAQCFHDQDRLRKLVLELSTQHEAGSDNPWNGEFDERMLKAIVGIDLEITEIQCKFKLSQNRSVADQDNVIEQLDARGEHELALQMRNMQSNKAR